LRQVEGGTLMAEYRVEWSIEVEADSPEQAARRRVLSRMLGNFDCSRTTSRTMLSAWRPRRARLRTQLPHLRDRLTGGSCPGEQQLNTPSLCTKPLPSQPRSMPPARRRPNAKRSNYSNPTQKPSTKKPWGPAETPISSRSRRPPDDRIRTDRGAWPTRPERSRVRPIRRFRPLRGRQSRPRDRRTELEPRRLLRLSD